MKKTALTATFLTAALVAVSAFAQMGPGSGMGPGGKGRFAWNQDYTRGWTLMTPDERTVWQLNMREVKTFDECKALQAEHHNTMEARAKEKGITLAEPSYNGCDMLKSRGFIK